MGNDDAFTVFFVDLYARLGLHAHAAAACGIGVMIPSRPKI